MQISQSFIELSSNLSQKYKSEDTVIEYLNNNWKNTILEVKNSILDLKNKNKN